VRRLLPARLGQLPYARPVITAGVDEERHQARVAVAQHVGRRHHRDEAADGWQPVRAATGRAVGIAWDQVIGSIDGHPVAGEIDEQHAAGRRVRAGLLDRAIDAAEGGATAADIADPAFLDLVIGLNEGGFHRADGRRQALVVEFLIVVVRDTDEEGMPIGHGLRLMRGNLLR